MQNLPEQNFVSGAVAADSQPLSYPKRIEIWSGRLAMVGVMTTVAAIVLGSSY